MIDLPRPSFALAITGLTAGAFATIGFDLFGQFVSPALGNLLDAGPWLGAKLAPVPLATQSLSVLTGIESEVLTRNGIGHGLHILTGTVLYPFAYLFVARPISLAAGRVPWWLAGSVYGVVLFIFALYVMAHLVAGNPAFLGWGALTWVALWGHIIFGLIVAGIVRAGGCDSCATTLRGGIAKIGTSAS